MIHHIDLSVMLRQAVCDLYSNLVTRPTGAAVRHEIERFIGERRESSLTVIDFQHVGLLDFSCADEVVAKLLLGQVTRGATGEAYFLVRGVRDVHLDAIEAVLERYGLALVVDLDGTLCLVGDASDGERRAWTALNGLGRGRPREVAHALGEDLVSTAQWLGTLHERRLCMRLEDEYVAIAEPT